MFFKRFASSLFIGGVLLLSLFEASASPTLAPASIGDCQGVYVIKFANSPYNGDADEIIEGDTFDGEHFELGAYCGLEIHGDNEDNTIIGSHGDD
ncbi:MAG: hypothetical protein D6712_16955, partial [Chloroflexi bacterium]